MEAHILLRTRWSYEEMLATPESLIDAIVDVAAEQAADPFEDV